MQRATPLRAKLSAKRAAAVARWLVAAHGGAEVRRVTEGFQKPLPHRLERDGSRPCDRRVVLRNVEPAPAQGVDRGTARPNEMIGRLTTEATEQIGDFLRALGP